MESDDEDLHQVLARLMAKLDRIEELLTTIGRRSSVIIGDVWWLREEWHRQGFRGEDRRRWRAHGSG